MPRTPRRPCPSSRTTPLDGRPDTIDLRAGERRQRGHDRMDRPERALGPQPDRARRHRRRVARHAAARRRRGDARPPRPPPNSSRWRGSSIAIGRRDAFGIGRHGRCRRGSSACRSTRGRAAAAGRRRCARALAKTSPQRLERLQHRAVVGGMDDRRRAEGREVDRAGSGRWRLNSVKLVSMPPPISASGKAARASRRQVRRRRPRRPGAVGLVAGEVGARQRDHPRRAQTRPRRRPRRPAPAPRPAARPRPRSPASAPAPASRQPRDLAGPTASIAHQRLIDARAPRARPAASAPPSAASCASAMCGACDPGVAGRQPRRADRSACRQGRPSRRSAVRSSRRPGHANGRGRDERPAIGLERGVGPVALVLHLEDLAVHRDVDLDRTDAMPQAGDVEDRLRRRNPLGKRRRRTDAVRPDRTSTGVPATPAIGCSSTNPARLTTASRNAVSRTRALEPPANRRRRSPRDLERALESRRRPCETDATP